VGVEELASHMCLTGRFAEPAGLIQLIESSLARRFGKHRRKGARVCGCSPSCACDFTITFMAVKYGAVQPVARKEAPDLRRC
jgi:hypothetical protein